MGLLGVILLMIVTILPSSAQQNNGTLCWQKIENCMENSYVNLSPGSVSSTEYLCCSLIEEEWKTDKKCFCRLDISDQFTMAAVLSDCSLPTYGVLCSDTSTSSPYSSISASTLGSSSVASPKATSSRKVNIALALGVTFSILVIFGVVIGGICVYCRQLARNKPQVTNYQNGNVAMENVHAMTKPYVANYQSSVGALVEALASPYVEQYQAQVLPNIVPSAPTQYDIGTVLEAAINNFSNSAAANAI